MPVVHDFDVPDGPHGSLLHAHQPARCGESQREQCANNREGKQGPQQDLFHGLTLVTGARPLPRQAWRPLMAPRLPIIRPNPMDAMPDFSYLAPKYAIPAGLVARDSARDSANSPNTEHLLAFLLVVAIGITWWLVALA